MEFGQLFRILKSRFWLVVSIFLITLCTAIGASMLITKRYSAQTALFIDIPSTDPVLGGAVMNPQSVIGYLSTQSDIIRSDRVVKKVIAALALDKDPLTIAEWHKEAAGEGDIRNWIVRSLLKQLSVDPSREGSTISIAFEGKDPAQAAKIADAFARAYIETTLELKVQPAAEYAQWFESKTKAYRAEVDKAQAKLSAYQQSSGIVATDERFDVENQRLTELSTQLVAIQGAAADSRSRRDAIQRDGREAMPEVVQNQLIQSLKAEVGRAEARLQEASSRLGPNHPQMVSGQAELAALKSRLDSEIGRVTSSIASSSAVNAQRESEINAALEAQRAKVLKLKKERDQMAVLQREVDSAQKSLDLVAQRLTATNLESQARQTNVSILSPAVQPLEPSRPKPLLNSIVGAFVGLLIGVLAALALEVVQKPLRTSEDILSAVGVPVLAVLPRSSSTRPQRLIGSTGPTMRPPTLQLGN